jgi:hypothetical protein
MELGNSFRSTQSGNIRSLVLHGKQKQWDGRADGARTSFSGLAPGDRRMDRTITNQRNLF